MFTCNPKRGKSHSNSIVFSKKLLKVGLLEVSPVSSLLLTRLFHDLEVLGLPCKPCRMKVRKGYFVSFLAPSSQSSYFSPAPQAFICYFVP